MKRYAGIFALAALALPLAACGATGDTAAGGDELTSGPITIWYSTNEQEIAWAEEVVEAWNTEHPDEQVEAAAIPAGKSSEDAIGAAITAGNTPCLVYNTAPAAVPGFQKQGGLVNISTTFDDGESFVAERSGGAADGFRSPDGDLYQVPWKANPFMLYYNKDVFAEAGLDPENPELATYDDVLAAAAAIEQSGAADYTLYPPASGDYTNALFDFYPFFLANSGGTQLVSDGGAAFTSEEGLETLDFWKSMYGPDPSPTASPRWASQGRGVRRHSTARSTTASCRCRRLTALRPRRHTRSAIRRTSGSTPRARTSRRRGNS